MADTSELLARTARLAYFDNPPVDEWDRLEATSKAAWLRVATAVTRLQAEAPEDVEVRAEAERMLHQIKTKSVPLLDWNARVARLATFVLQFRTSQAEAQAPTTAAQASVLTVGALLSKAQADAVTLLGGKVEIYDPTLHCDNKCLRNGHCMGGGCDEFRLVEYPRFTVGAPAPAPTSWMPIETAPKDGTRFIADLQKYGVHVMRWHAWDGGGMWKTDYQFVPINMIEKAFKGWQPLPAPLFAKGDTP